MKIRNAFRREVTLFLLLSLLQQQVAAQDTSFTQTMDYILAPLDKNRIPTGILYERVMPWANIDLYNDAGQNPPPCNFDFFMQAYNELFIAAYNKAGWHQPIKLRNRSEAEAYEKRYMIGVLDYSFNMIDSNAINNGWLSLSNG